MKHLSARNVIERVFSLLKSQGNTSWKVVLPCSGLVSQYYSLLFTPQFNKSRDNERRHAR